MSFHADALKSVLKLVMLEKEKTRVGLFAGLQSLILCDNGIDRKFIK
jgi:hypothetical protein